MCSLILAHCPTPRPPSPTILIPHCHFTHIFNICYLFTFCLCSCYQLIGFHIENYSELLVGGCWFRLMIPLAIYPLMTYKTDQWLQQWFCLKSTSNLFLTKIEYGLNNTYLESELIPRLGRKIPPQTYKYPNLSLFWFSWVFSMLTTNMKTTCKTKQNQNLKVVFTFLFHPSHLRII